MSSDYNNFKYMFYFFSDTKEASNKKVTICHLQASERWKITPTWQDRFSENSIRIAALKEATI